MVSELSTDHNITSGYHSSTIITLLLCTRTKAVLSRSEDVAKDRNTRYHLAWTIGNGDPMHGVCIQHSILDPTETVSVK